VSHGPPEPFAWSALNAPDRPLNLDSTLRSGQAFRWRRDAAGIWWGVVDRTVVALFQDEAPDSNRGGRPSAPVFWQTFPEQGRWPIVRDYLGLEIDLPALYELWLAAEPRMLPAIDAYWGMRVLRQPPTECFFSFQCAACNTIVKIERSVELLSRRYGEPIETGLDSPARLYAFPSIEALANADEAVLRSDLWGYRAPRVIQLARTLAAMPVGWLESLRGVPYAEARRALAGLSGVGLKIADCVCLCALDRDEAVPIDTHTRRIACRLWAPELAHRSLTPRVYEALACAFRSRFGAHAGWAQLYLFFADTQRGRNEGMKGWGDEGVEG
jgi:N-glycosylase/DNA lyase